MTQTGGIFKQPDSMPQFREVDNAIPEKALFTEILQKYEGDPWLRITHVEITSACNIGDNYMSTVQRAYVEGFRSNDKPFRKFFIMKRQMDNVERRQMLQVDQVWANEAHMYFTVMPRLRRHCTTDLPHPKLYYSNKDLMIMEDLKEKGYSMVDRFVGLDLEHSLLVMKALALLHSSSLAMKILDSEMFNIMKENLKHPYNGQIGENLGKALMENSLESAMSHLKSSNNEYEELLEVLKRVQKKHAKMFEFLNKNSWNRELSVVIHGDMWTNNILFSYNMDSTHPSVCKFVDFQCTRMGSLALDVLEFVYSSVRPEIRKEHYKTLIKCYYDSLISYLKSFVGCENSIYIKELTIEKLEEELSEYRVFGLLHAIMMLPIITYEAQSDDLGTPNKVLSIQRPFWQTYKGRLIDILEEYKKNGWA